MGHENLQVVDQRHDGRYELQRGDELIGYATYQLSETVMTIPHVQTLPEYRGNGFADILMGGIIADVRERRLTVRPLCPFAADFMRDRASTHDLIAT